MTVVTRRRSGGREPSDQRSGDDRAHLGGAAPRARSWRSGRKYSPQLRRDLPVFSTALVDPTDSSTAWYHK